MTTWRVYYDWGQAPYWDIEADTFDQAEEKGLAMPMPQNGRKSILDIVPLKEKKKNGKGNRSRLVRKRGGKGRT